jgi:hypothetical protein
MPRFGWPVPRPLAPLVAGLASSADVDAPEPVRMLPDGSIDQLFALLAGLRDQAHVHRDCRALARVAPSELRARAADPSDSYEPRAGGPRRLGAGGPGA